MSTIPKYTPGYTYNDYILWEGKWELIEGIPYAMSPAPTTRHQRISAEFISLFVFALKKCKNCKAYSPIDWKVSEDTVLQPDALVLCRPVGNLKFIDFPPSLVAEIISPSSSLTDRREKFEIYEREGVKYYVIIDPAFNKLEVFENIGSVYQPVAVNPDEFPFSFDHECAVSINFQTLFID